MAEWLSEVPGLFPHELILTCCSAPPVCSNPHPAKITVTNYRPVLRQNQAVLSRAQGKKTLPFLAEISLLTVTSSNPARVVSL